MKIEFLWLMNDHFSTTYVEQLTASTKQCVDQAVCVQSVNQLG